ncbi:single-stranded DNA-binding protein [Helicobacter bilis]|uniref:Single-stranded DNA-binding protein n=1 Tax=Helicobacter bilis TaxID=37372 RepID=A0A4V6I625_9HELI|nr:single-stranded DNA-binding protein [Helicobacter bilis]MCI7410424.1 single-stranded DNA-binding protein [Helicobacter bilis]MDD7296862.1 single-stranded DNA-binding protein [Helicobacter bilis]MDY4399771.1 single-stranded DNA-binding protein [Helicobacter bilis]TLE10429.1 single-stranded DNA-binding protein [Helicobacter bilis]
MNKVILIGNLTKEVEIRQLTSGSIVGNMSLAVNRHFVRTDGTKDSEVCYIDLAVYGKSAELCKQWLVKGSKVCVEGRLVYQQWQTQSGEKRSKHVVSVEKVEFLGSPNANNGNAEENNTKVVNPQVETQIDFGFSDEIPF